jgi:hypothetical protein
MTTPFTINATAQQIEDAILNVVGADATPQSPSTKMVTSQGVKTYVDDSLTDIGVSQIDQNLLIKENNAEFNIDTTVGDTHLVTSAAIKEYVKSKALPTIDVFRLNDSNTVSNSGYSPATSFENLSAAAYGLNTQGVDGGGAHVTSGLNTNSITVPNTGTSYIHLQGVFSSTRPANFYVYSGTSIYRYIQFFKLFINGTEDMNLSFESFIGGSLNFMREVAPGDVITYEAFSGDDSQEMDFDGKMYFYNYNF